MDPALILWLVLMLLTSAVCIGCAALCTKLYTEWAKQEMQKNRK